MAFEALALGEILRAQAAAWGALPSVWRWEETCWGRKDLALDPPLPLMPSVLRGPEGGLQAGCRRPDTCCVTKLRHSSWPVERFMKSV